MVKASIENVVADRKAQSANFIDKVNNFVTRNKLTEQYGMYRCEESDGLVLRLLFQLMGFESCTNINNKFCVERVKPPRATVTSKWPAGKLQKGFFQICL